MFLHLLNPPEGEAFVLMAQRLIRADGELSVDEVGLMEQFRAQLKIGEVADLPDARVEDLAARFMTRRARVVAMLELIGLGFIDGEFHPSEREFIKEVAMAFDFTEFDVLSFEGWVARQAALHQEAAGFWLSEEN